MQDVVADLERIYRDLDEELERLGVKCSACGKCCDFGKADYALYSSTVELAYLNAGQSQAAPTLEQGVCCFRDSAKCTVHEVRPLGCRTFFCDPKYKPLEQDLYHKYYRRIQSLADRHGVSWEYAPFF